MNETERANRFRDDLDAILQGHLPDTPPSTDEYQEILALSQTLSELDMSDESRIRHSLKNRLLAVPVPGKRSPLNGDSKMNTDIKRANRPLNVLAASAFVMVLVVVTVLAIPGVSASAAALFRFFAPGNTDADPGAQPTVPPPPQGASEIGEYPEAQAGLTLDEVIQAVEQDEAFTYAVKTPAFLPANMTYADGIVNSFGRMVILNYVCDDWLAELSVSMRGLANPNPMIDPGVELPVGGSAAVEVLDLDGTPAEYVRGDFVDGIWDATQPVQTLSWELDQVLYRLRSYVQAGSTCSISRDDLIAVAASLLP